MRHRREWGLSSSASLTPPPLLAAGPVAMTRLMIEMQRRHRADAEILPLPEPESISDITARVLQDMDADD